jgi:hypothetical protein
MDEQIATYQTGDAVQVGVETGGSHIAVTAFIDENTKLSYRMYPKDIRLTFSIGSGTDEVAIFAHGPDLDRFIVALIAAREDLITEAGKILLPNRTIDLFPID